MKPKVWSVTFGVVALLLIGGAAFYCLKAKSGYDTAMAGWGNKLQEIKTLSAQVPHPSQEVEDALRENLKTYEAEVKALYENLNQFQKPLNQTLQNTEFQQVVIKKVDAIKALSNEKGFTINRADEFYLGFDTYKSALPSPDIVPILDFELGAIDHLIRKMIASGGDSLVELQRELVPGEAGATSEKQENSVVHKYPVRIRFYGTHKSFQDFLNGVANDKEYFYTIRVMKVTNEQPESPPKTVAVAGDDYPVFRNPFTQEVATITQMEEIGKWPSASEAELIKNMKEAGFEPAGEDAKVLMGQEKLNVFMVVDLVRFLDPDEVKASEEAEAAEASAQKKPRRR